MTVCDFCPCYDIVNFRSEDYASLKRFQIYKITGMTNIKISNLFLTKGKIRRKLYLFLLSLKFSTVYDEASIN